PDIVFLAVSNNGINGLKGNGGIWRGNTLTNVWVNLTGGKTPTDDPSITLSPGDDYSDLVVMRDVNPFTAPFGVNRIIIAAVGTAGGGSGILPNITQNGVYISTDAGVTWSHNSFPLQDPGPLPHNGNFKVGAAPGP